MQEKKKIKKCKTRLAASQLQKNNYAQTMTKDPSGKNMGYNDNSSDVVPFTKEYNITHYRKAAAKLVTVTIS